VRSADPALADAADVVEQVLADPRGWSRAGFRLVREPGATFVVVLAEADEVDRLCRPYDTFGLYSCQNGPVVALNAERWRTATPEWTGDLDTYRQMLVNHEVGHLLGQHHPPAPQCPVPGELALVMAQQSTELDGCLPNPWPLRTRSSGPRVTTSRSRRRSSRRTPVAEQRCRRRPGQRGWTRPDACASRRPAHLVTGGPHAPPRAHVRPSRLLLPRGPPTLGRRLRPRLGGRPGDPRRLDRRRNCRGHARAPRHRVAVRRARRHHGDQHRLERAQRRPRV
jgi:hypothetical protein